MSLNDKSSYSATSDSYLYLISQDGLSAGKAPLSSITEIAEASQTINLNSSMTASEIQDEIDGLSSFIPGVNVTFRFADGTYNLDQPLYFQGFYGNGQITIAGNASDSASLNTSQSVHLNFNNDTDGVFISNNSGISLVIVEKLRITVQDGNSAIKIQRDGHSRVRYNYLTGGGTTNGNNTGIYVIGGNRCQTTNNYFSNFFYGIRAHKTSMVSSNNNDDTGTQPRYGLGATQASFIGKNGTQPTGSLANETSSTGSQIIS